MGQPRPVFLPSRDGFPFANAWPSAPAVSIRTPLGTLGIGNAARGLCGGMIFAALDYWHARLPPPPGRPAPGTPLYRFIVRRLVESWHVPSGVATYYRWMNLPDSDVRRPRFGRLATRRGLSRRTIEQQWPLIRARLDSGQPACLGVVTVASASPAMLGHNHQVLAYGYQVAGPAVTVRVYDPNSGPDDDVRIRFDASAPAATFTHNIGIGWPVRGFFLTPYSPVIPPDSGRRHVSEAGPPAA